jgi:hypothetical protein|tara:strand:+ start:522 stop:1097 length:576 start_codon:yes stop_codon:yes gene_type:complete
MPNVTSVKSKKFVQGTHTSMISASGTATSLNIDVGEFVNAQTVTITSSANNSGITFTVVGTDANGAAQTSAATTGPNANTIDIGGTWLTVTSITASGSITTDISAGVKNGVATGTLFAGATRVRGMTGNGAAAGHINFKNSSTTGTTFHTEYVRDDLIDPYIPDNGIYFPNGCYMQGTSGAVVGLSVFYDG